MKKKVEKGSKKHHMKIDSIGHNISYNLFKFVCGLPDPFVWKTVFKQKHEKFPIPNQS